MHILSPAYKCNLEKPFRMWEAAGDPCLREGEQNLLQSD